MTFPRRGRVNTNGKFDLRYARGLGRTPRQRRADFYRSTYIGTPSTPSTSSTPSTLSFLRGYY